jgi:hypothetical protein
MPRFSPRLATLFAIAFCISWQSAVTGSSTAQAACGDYVHLGTIKTEGIPLGSTDAVFGLNSRDQEHKLPRRSCDGPHCRQQPLTPAAPAPVPTQNGPQQKACLAEQTVPMLPVSHTFIPQLALRHDELPESRIERPPRHYS